MVGLSSGGPLCFLFGTWKRFFAGLLRFAQLTALSAGRFTTNMADVAQQQQYLDHINSENDELEAEIMRMSQAKMADTKQIAATVKAVRAPGSGIVVLDFGSLDHAECAGIDRGSAWRPTQTKPRTLSGAFFTS